MADKEDLDSIPDHTHDKKNPLLLPVRIVLFALLAVGIVAFIFDRLARHKANEAFQKLDAQLGPEQRLNAITRDEVHKLIGRAPDDDGDPDDVFETYTWQGAFKPQILYVEYRPGSETVLKDISLNECPRHFLSDRYSIIDVGRNAPCCWQSAKKPHPSVTDADRWPPTQKWSSCRQCPDK